MTSECDLLLTGGSVITLDDARRVIEPGAVAVSGDRIATVGTVDELSGTSASRVVDCAGKVLVPGFVDCHNHLFQTLGRGLGEGLSGWEWLSAFMWPYAGTMRQEDVRAAVRLGAVEAIRAGTTTILDHHYGLADLDTTLQVASILEAAGLRGVVARGISGPLSETGAKHGLPPSAFRYTSDEELDTTRACMDARPPGGRVSICPGPINIVYTEPDLLRASSELAREHETVWHTHCCAPRQDPGIFEAAHGVRPVEWLSSEGMLGTHTALAHATWLSDREVELLGRSTTGIAHCPGSNLYVPYGVMRLRDLRSAGAVVGLGTDGSACGHRQDMFEQMKLAVLLHRLHTLDPVASSPEEALELATREGARLLGIDGGVIEPGKLADLVVVDFQRPHLKPLHRTVSSLVYAARGSDVDLVIVGGDVIFEEGRCTRMDEAAVLAEAQACADDLARRAGLDGLLLPWKHTGPSSADAAARARSS